MNDKPSFWETTNRQNITAENILKAQRVYSFNYLHFLPQSKNAKIVELGCSEGITLEWLAKLGYSNICGIDSDSVAINQAQERLRTIIPKNCMEVGDALDHVRHMEKESVDLLVMFNVVEHLDKTTLLNLICEVNRVLKVGGIFLTQTGNIENPFNFGLYARDFTHQIAFTSSSLRQVMVMSGFKKKDVSVSPVKYDTTLRNFSFQLTSRLLGYAIKLFAFWMRIRIDETSPLIYCVARKMEATSS